MLKTQNIIPKNRFYIATGVVVGIVFLLLIRFFQIQILNYETFSQKADTNRIRAVSLNAPRGLILDRNGKILVDNYPTFILNAIPGELQNKTEQFLTISRSIGIDTTTLMSNYNKYYRGRFAPARLAKDLTINQIGLLEEHRLDLAGIQYDFFPERIYPAKIRGAHFLGYVQEVNRNIFEQLDKAKHYEYGDLIGWKGLEKEYENQLRGTAGVTYLQVNAFGQTVGSVESRLDRKPIPGNNLILTIDDSLQHLMEKSLMGYIGVALVADSRDGSILAYASSPDYPPEMFTGVVSEQEWNDLLTDPDRPLLDRNLSGLYPPGSTFKMVTLIALAETGKLRSNFRTFCTGTYHYGDRDFHCWKENGHGEVNLRRALAESCNIYFYQIVTALTIEEWSEVALELGFGKRTMIDLPFEQKGVVPTRKYMNTKYGRYGWSKGVMLNLALGQGDIMVTPLQLLEYTSLIATSGQSMSLHLNMNAENVEPVTADFSMSSWQLLDNLMQAVIYDAGGTGKSANPRIPGLILAGKTGTAQNPHGEPHAWFLGYGKMNDRIVSCVVLVEGGGHGGETAAPIARKAFRYIFSQDRQSLAAR